MKKKTFCYWSIGDGNHGKLCATMVSSARDVGVKADFHIFTDLKEIPGAIVHPCGNFDKKLYMFKFEFLKNEISKLNYDYFVFLDSDNYFVRDPGDLTKLMDTDDKIFVQLENEVDPKTSKRGDWWGCPINKYKKFMNDVGIVSNKYYNTNAGFWIVRKDAIDEFYEKTQYYFKEAHDRKWNNTTEEFALAAIGMSYMQNQDTRTFEKTSNIWASDWTGNWKDRIPENKNWNFEDYMTGEKHSVNPAIVHGMRSKDAMIAYYDVNINKPKGCGCNKSKPINIDDGFWCGHQMLGDVIGFCAAAHLLHHKTGKIIKINFEEKRKDAAKYFKGIKWVPKDEIPNAVDCGHPPSIPDWKNFNGVKRFYRWMDPTMKPGKSFDIHMNCKKNKKTKKLIGLITHANTQGDIPIEIVDSMIKEAKKKYPKHKIILFGNKDNTIIPKGVVDMRQENGDINWIINFMKDLDLLISPQTGPCFIAAGLKIPMWIYKSKQPHWDYVLNYDTQKVQKWWDRPKNTYEVFDDLYTNGGWSGQGSGPGSKVEVNKEYLYLLHKIIDYTPSIQTIVDIGCGDFNLMKELKHNKKYIGLDVSNYVIDQNNKKYKTDKISFDCKNAVKDDLPDGDLCIIKDVLQHLPIKDVTVVLEKMKKYKYCIITNDYTGDTCGDINIGEWRPINVLLAPFNIDGITLYGYIGKQVILWQPKK